MAKSREARNESVRSRRRYEGFKDTPEGDFYTKSPFEGHDVKQVYRDNQWHGQSSSVRPPTHLSLDSVGTLHREEQQQLPGTENPHALPTTRWEDLTPQRRADIQATVRQRHGVTLDDMVNHIGTTIDRAHMRAGAGRDPEGHDFYDQGEPARLLQHDARIGTGTVAEPKPVPFGAMAAVHSATSPNMQFRFVPKDGGPARYPNQEQAAGALRLVGRGVTPEEVAHDPVAAKKEAGLSGPAMSGFHGNFVKAVRYGHQLVGGTPITELRGNPSSTNPEGPRAFSDVAPKTAAYHNSWLHDVPPTWVADVHSGAGTAFPHLLSASSPVMKPGDKGSNKTEQEAALGSASGLHSMIHHAAEIAMAQRGLTSVPETQAGQWQELRRHKVEIGHNRIAGPEFRTTQNETHPHSDHPQLF